MDKQKTEYIKRIFRKGTRADYAKALAQYLFCELTESWHGRIPEAEFEKVRQKVIDRADLVAEILVDGDEFDQMALVSSITELSDCSSLNDPQNDTDINELRYAIYDTAEMGRDFLIDDTLSAARILLALTKTAIAYHDCPPVNVGSQTIVANYFYEAYRPDKSGGYEIEMSSPCVYTAEGLPKAISYNLWRLYGEELMDAMPRPLLEIEQHYEYDYTTNFVCVLARYAHIAQERFPDFYKEHSFLFDLCTSVTNTATLRLIAPKNLYNAQFSDRFAGFEEYKNVTV